MIETFFILNFDGCTSRSGAKHRAQVIGKHTICNIGRGVELQKNFKDRISSLDADEGRIRRGRTLIDLSPRN